MRNPNRFDFFWVLKPLSLHIDAIDAPFDGLTILETVIGEHVVTVEYLHGSWWMLDERNGDIVVVLPLPGQATTARWPSPSATSLRIASW